MNISWDTVQGSNMLFRGWQYDLLCCVRSVPNQVGRVRVLVMPALALPTSVAYLALGVAKSICHVAEAIFKGFANLFAFPFLSDFKCHRAFVFIGGESLAGVAELTLEMLKAAVVVAIVAAEGFS